MQEYTNQSGRSMTEMLGVLAVIGVLSIGGIQGYTYAMNKYRANNVLNEINMASHQLATELVTSRNAQKILSLGNPYDDGAMTTENYLFNYGCGNEGTPERACQQAEQGYWMSVGGLTEKICQNMLSEARFLPYIVARKLNGETVADGTNCAEENNEITFLFNVNETGTNDEGATSDEPDNNTPPVSCPKDTSEDGEGGLATILTDTKTGKVIQCYCVKKDKKYANGLCNESLPEICSSNADCNRGDYCDITDYGDNYCTHDTGNMKGSCRKVSSDKKTPKTGTNPPFVMSSKGITWWSAKNFCQALGKTLVEISDYGCAHSICSTGCSNAWGYCHADTSISVTTSDISNISANVKAIKAAYGSSFWGWMNIDYNSCNAYYVNFSNGYMYYGIRYRPNVAVCK